MESGNISKKKFIVDRYTWLDNHPKAEEIRRWNIGSPIYQKTVLQVYLDLCEVKNWFQLTLHGLPLYNVIYISGKPDRKNKEKNIVLPVNAQSNITMARLREMIHQINDSRSITLAACESDSTVVYYEVENYTLHGVIK